MNINNVGLIFERVYYMKKLIAVLTAAVIFTCTAAAAENKYITEYYTDDILAAPTFSQAEPTAVGAKLDIKAKSALLLEPKTGKVLYESNADEKLAPASITKIMSLLLIMEALDKGFFKLDTQITASEHACSMGGSQIWLEPGETMTVDEMLRATVIASANDTTVALAEAVSGSEEGFVELMNKRAGELGMKNTVFKNASGLDAEGHYSSARDVAIMSAELIKHDLIKKYSTVWMDTLRGGESQLVNTNKLVRYYEGCTGLKTGTTGTAGYCLSATAERNGLELVAVIMGGETSNDRFNGARKLLDYGFSNYSFMEIAADASLLKPIKVKNGMQATVGISAGGVCSLLLPKGSGKNITQTAELPSELEAPVKKGEQIGKIHLSLDGKEVGVIPLTAADDVVKINFFSSFLSLLESILVP